MSIRFRANNDALTVTPPSGDFSICGWFSVGADRNYYSTLLSFDNNNTSTFNLAFLQTNATGTTLNLWTGVSSPVDAFFLKEIYPGAMLFAALTKGGDTFTGAVRLFEESTLSVASNTMVMSCTHLRVGRSQWVDEWFDGRAQNVKIWSRALSASELLVESHNERVVNGQSLWSYLPLRSVGNLEDMSGRGNAASVLGSPGSSDDFASLLRMTRPRRGVQATAAAGIYLPWVTA